MQFHSTFFNHSSFLSKPAIPEPRRDSSIRFKGRQNCFLESSLAVDEDALVVPETAELMRFDFVFFGFGIVHIALAGTVSPRALHHVILAQKVSSLNGIQFVGGAEDHAV